MEAKVFAFYEEAGGPASEFSFTVAQDTLARAVEDYFAAHDEYQAYAICAYGFADGVPYPEDWPFNLSMNEVLEGFVEVDFYTGGLDFKVKRYYVHEVREVEAA